MAFRWKRLDKYSTPMIVIGFIGIIVSMIGMALLDGGGTGDLDYSFSLEREEVLVTVLKDGSVDIDYTFDFVNYGELDGIDVGLPNNWYDEDSAWAYVEVDGKRYDPDKIHKSPYVSVGLAVEFTDRCRRAVEKGDATPFSVRFHVNQPHMVYKNELQKGTVGIRFRPTWFDPDFQEGPTQELVVRVVLPPGHTDLNTTYPIKGSPWDSSYVTTEDRLMVTWVFGKVQPTSQSDGIYDVGVAFPKDRVNTFFEDDKGSTFRSLGEFCFVLWPVWLAAVSFLMVFVGIKVSEKTRKEEYFDPELCVEGASARRDLTAVEAAIVLEVPIDRVGTMVLFGLERKGIVEIDIEEEPIRVEKLADVGEYMYETRFLSAIRSDGEISKKVLKKVMVKLVDEVEEKMKGFGLEQTRTYYRAIVDRAWKEVETTGTVDDMSSLLKEKNEWLMLDDDYTDHMGTIHVVYGASSGTPVAAINDVRGIAKGYVDRVRSTSSNLVKDVKSLTTDVTSVTHPPPVSSGGGGGCACACACAGGGR
jgi:hypothetical protein